MDIPGFTEMNVDVLMAPDQNIDTLIGTVNKQQIEHFEPEMLLAVEKVYVLDKPGHFKLRCALSKNWNITWDADQNKDVRNDKYPMAEWPVLKLTV